MVAEAIWLARKKGVERCKCYWNDDLSPIIERIFAADALIIGSPNYLGNITSQVFALMECLRFCALSYDDYSNYFKGKVNVGVILTMNAGKMIYKTMYKKSMERQLEPLKVLNGSMEIYPCCDTLQVDDYNKYNMSSFNEKHKRNMRNKQFPHDLQEAYSL